MKSNPKSPVERGFTLVEVLIAISIILVLATFSIGGFTYIRGKQDEQKAKIQIALLEQGLQEYKLDFGSFPASAGTTTELYTALYTNGLAPGEKIYVPDLKPSNKQKWVVGNTIVDPFGNEYIYRSPGTVNPDFDLLSMGPDGVTGTPDDEADDIANY